MNNILILVDQELHGCLLYTGTIRKRWCPRREREQRSKGKLFL